MRHEKIDLMSEDVCITELGLLMARTSASSMRRFYSAWGAVSDDRPDGGFTVAIGDGAIRFVATADDGARPFGHHALLVPGDRFEAARAWLSAQTELLPKPGSTDPTFVFSDWDALACYAHDPAGNIVELIAHSELCRCARSGPFEGSELCGISEIGLVVDDRGAALASLASAGVELWDGSADPDGLSFVGSKGRTLILAPVGRGWWPTGRPSESWPLTADVSLGEGQTVRVALADGVLSAHVLGNRSA